MDLNDNLAEGETNNSIDYISMLASTLYRADKQLQILEDKLRLSEKACLKKDLKIVELQKKLTQMLKNSIYSNEDSSPSSSIPDSARMHNQELFSLERKCEKLQNKVCEMVNFLADYGLVWVGEDNKSKLSPFFNGKSPDFPRLLQCIEDLNQMAGYGEPQIYFTNEGATFKTPDSIPLVLYADGLTLFSGPFRAYTTRSTQQFLQDILDGFFPSELQHDYPDGVCFQVIDKHEISYKSGRKWKPFVGKGYKLGCKGSNDDDADMHEIAHKSTMSNEIKSQKVSRVHSVESSIHRDIQCGDNEAIKVISSENSNCDISNYKWKSSILNSLFNIPSNNIQTTEFQGKKRILHPQKLASVPVTSKKREEHKQSTASVIKTSSGSCSSRKYSASSLISADINSNKKIKHNKDSESKREFQIIGEEEISN
ncbi:hypothetical protein L9F63_023520 [Diploptera punctata]|uniref:UBX domain-containing protein 11 n=1 Tax=Diploptera punctata TaxID=6984 RepID=A0AAD8E8L6_DIPPU|nr:hypothetical protein L9F63_023520 [Diploptera punctata]